MGAVSPIAHFAHLALSPLSNTKIVEKRYLYSIFDEAPPSNKTTIPSSTDRHILRSPAFDRPHVFHKTSNLARTSPRAHISSAIERTLLNMASVIILRYNDDAHLVPKPADYATLISVARAKFPELHEVDNDSIVFHFTPEWFNSEVKLDRDAFAEVHNRAVLRITTTATVPAQHLGKNDIIQAGDLADSHSYDVPPDAIIRLCVIDGKCMVNPRYLHARMW